MLVILTGTQVSDPDIGFYIAIGREVRAGGLPAREFYLPLLDETPFASLHVLGSVILSMAWDFLGPSGVTLLKVACYGGGFLLCAWAALRRGAAPAIVLLLVSAAAAAVAPRFVDRSGMFSVLLLSALHLLDWKALGREGPPPVRKWLGPLIVGLSMLWSWCHAEWYIGLAMLSVVVLKQEVSTKAKAVLLLGAWLVPWLSFLAIHPWGLRAILQPLAFLGGGEETRFAIAEYQAAAWQGMRAAIALAGALVVTAGWLLWSKRWLEGLLLAGLLLLALKIPRAILPAAVVGVVPLCELTTSLVGNVARRNIVLVSTILALIAIMASGKVGRDNCFGIHPSLEVREVGRVLEGIKKPEGPLLAEFAWSSLLLSEQGVVRQGVVMDGRQEAYRGDYYERIYLPFYMLPEGPEWADHVRRTGIAFYFEPFPRRATDIVLMDRFTRAGWKLVSYSNSGRLAARPDVVERHTLRPLRFDPARLSEVIGNEQLMAAARDELREQTFSIYSRRESAGRLLSLTARLELRVGDRSDAMRWLKFAAKPSQGGWNYASTFLAYAEIALLDGRHADALAHLEEAESLVGSSPELDAIKSQVLAVMNQQQGRSSLDAE